MSKATRVQPKLMDYYVQNGEEFKEKFRINDILDVDYIGTEDSSQYLKFTKHFSPTHLQRIRCEPRFDQNSFHPNGYKQPIGLNQIREGEQLKINTHILKIS